MILIVSFPDNQHVEVVRRHLHTEHAVLDVADFPERAGLAARAGKAGYAALLRLADGREIDLDDITAVWYRRLRPFVLNPGLDPVGAYFAQSETNEATLGLWYGLDAFWMNHPLAEESAQRKVLQLKVATEVGLSVPETLVTNEPRAARDFIDAAEGAPVIRKAFRNIAEATRHTALVGEDDLPLLDLVRHAPVIFQRFVPAEADLRVTMVDGEAFAALIRSGPEYQVDYRPGLGSATVTAHRLPATVEEGLRMLMERLHVSYGAIDLRLTPEGEYVFLEINPAGEFLFASSRTGQPVPEAIAAALTRGTREQQARLEAPEQPHRHAAP